MNPIAHGELAWLICAQPLEARRDRALVTWAGVLPDLDGLTILAWPLDKGDAYGHYHHLLTHSLPAAVVLSALFAGLATKEARARVAALTFLAFHLHLACDLLGSGRFWPIYYLYPFSELLVQPFSFGWELDAWQNMVIGLAATGLIIGMAPFLGRTFIEALSGSWDAVVVATFRKWAGRPNPRPAEQEP